MPTSMVSVALAAVLAWGQSSSHAQAPSTAAAAAPALPDMASKGVQCQLVEDALFALVQIGPNDGPDSLAVQSLQQTRADMQPEALRLYQALAQGFRGSDAYDNGAQAYAAAVGMYVDRALRGCAQAWFPQADAQRVDACVNANLAGAAASQGKRRDWSVAKALQLAQKAAPVGEELAKEVVAYFYRFPASAYEQPGASRISGGAKELCLNGQWPLASGAAGVGSSYSSSGAMPAPTSH